MPKYPEDELIRQTPQVRETKTISRLQEGIDMISTGLLMINECHTELINLGGPKVVDITARLNAQYLALEKIVNPLKENIKAESFRNKNDTVRGEMYQARVLKIVRTLVDVAKIKQFFGSQFSQYERSNSEIEVSFETKV